MILSIAALYNLYQAWEIKDQIEMLPANKFYLVEEYTIKAYHYLDWTRHFFFSAVACLLISAPESLNVLYKLFKSEKLERTWSDVIGAFFLFAAVWIFLAGL